jgi:hypothetical protein
VKHTKPGAAYGFSFFIAPHVFVAIRHEQPSPTVAREVSCPIIRSQHQRAGHIAAGTPRAFEPATSKYHRRIAPADRNGSLTAAPRCPRRRQRSPEAAVRGYPRNAGATRLSWPPVGISARGYASSPRRSACPAITTARTCSPQAGRTAPFAGRALAVARGGGIRYFSLVAIFAGFSPAIRFARPAGR